MKKIFIIALLVALTATPAMSLSIVNSSHDMIASGFAVGATSEVCVFCHTPHNAQTGTGGMVPLWNNTAATSVGLAVYTSPTINFTTSRAQINATDALICLACHDAGVGTPVNMPNAGAITVETTSTMSVWARMGTDMSNDHPIGMDLGSTSETNPFSTTASGLRTIAAIRGGAVGFGVDPFFGGVPNDGVNIMWCSTCHNVHDNANAPFLRKSNVGSALCKACHIK